MPPTVKHFEFERPLWASVKIPADRVTLSDVAYVQDFGYEHTPVGIAPNFAISLLSETNEGFPVAAACIGCSCKRGTSDDGSLNTACCQPMRRRARSRKTYALINSSAMPVIKHSTSRSSCASVVLFEYPLENKSFVRAAK